MAKMTNLIIAVQGGGGGAKPKLAGKISKLKLHLLSSCCPQCQNLILQNSQKKPDFLAFVIIML